MVSQYFGVLGTIFLTGGQRKYTCVKSPIEMNDTVWYIESYIKTRELTVEFWNSAKRIMGTAILILLLAGYFSRYFLRSIIKPVEEISHGLKQVEDGNLDIHLAPGGHYEVRTMIHQFNAMVRRLKVLINEYEERVRNVEKTPGDYLASMINGEMTPEEVNHKTKEFFKERYAVVGYCAEGYSAGESEADCAARLAYSFERNPRFASRCTLYMESVTFFLIMYRITEEEYAPHIITMTNELQKAADKEFHVHITACIGKESFGHSEFLTQVEEIRAKICLRHLMGTHAIVDLNRHNDMAETLLSITLQYEKLANALYTADEKNMTEEKQALFETYGSKPIQEFRIQVYAVILAIADTFDRDRGSFVDVFGEHYNYVDKIGRAEDARSLKLWLTNYLAWIMDYSASKLHISETDVIVKAKRYIADNCEDADLSLGKVAEHVGLNEKYFTNRFTKETGETFSSYLTGLRMQKARELLKTTSFKIYEIAEMSGYHSVEHFNRVFKKMNEVSPAQYRKTM